MIPIGDTNFTIGEYTTHGLEYDKYANGFISVSSGPVPFTFPRYGKAVTGVTNSDGSHQFSSPLTQNIAGSILEVTVHLANALKGTSRMARVVILQGHQLQPVSHHSSLRRTCFPISFKELFQPVLQVERQGDTMVPVTT